MPTIDYSKLLWTPFGNSPTNTFDRNNAPLPGLTSRSVSTVPIDPMTGNPIMQPSGPSFQAGMRGRGLSPVWANNSPGDIQSASAMNANDTVRDIPASSQPYIDATNPIDMFKQFGIMPSAPPNPAIGAIDQLTGSGRSTASPFPMPAFRSHLYSPTMRPGVPMSERNPGDWQVQAWLKQGSTMPSPAVNNPAAAIAGNPQVAQAMAANEARTPPPAPRQLSPEVHARLMAQQSPRASREQRIADAFRTDGVVAHRYADDADFLRNNTPGGRPDERALMREAQQAVMRAAKRKAPVPMPSPAFRNQSATVFDRSTGSFVTGRQPPPLPKRPSAEIKARLKAQQNGGNQSPKPAGYGSKGLSEAGRALQALYGN